MPKIVVCVVNGWAAGGGHSLHVVSDLSIASAEHGRFKQTDADVGSFDGGFGSAYLARQVGQKFAREIFFLGEEYSAEDAHRMGAVNKVVPHAELEKVALEWGAKINGKSPTAQRMLKYSFNLIDDGLVGQQLFAGETTRLAYMTDEAQEGRDQFLEKREPDWSPTPGTTRGRKGWNQSRVIWIGQFRLPSETSCPAPDFARARSAAGSIRASCDSAPGPLPACSPLRCSSWTLLDRWVSACSPPRSPCSRSPRS